MAILSANFSADFSKFQAAVEGAVAEMKTFESNAKAVADSMSRMENSISGVKIVQAATVAAEAVERLGGTSKLTYAELQKLGGTAQEAVDKMKALGQSVPTNLQDLADRARGAAEEVQRLSQRQGEGKTSAFDWGGALSMATGALGALGINATIGGVVDFTKEVIANANAIHDMAEKLNISAEAVQGFKGAAEKSGSSIDTVGAAILALNKNLAIGDTSTVEALKKMGLEFANVRGMKPEDAFITVGDAAAKMTDEFEQTASGTELVGKGFSELLPMMKAGTREVADSVEKMSDETIASLARAQTAWNEYSNHIKVVTGTVVAASVDATAHATSSWKNFTQFLLDAIKYGPGVAASMQAMNEQLDRSAEFVGPLQENAKAIGKTKEEIDRAKKAADDYAAAWDELNGVGRSYEEIVSGMNPKMVDQITHYLDAGASVSLLQKAYPGLVNEVKDLDAAMKAAKDTQEKWDSLEKKQADDFAKAKKEIEERQKQHTATVNQTVIDGNKKIMEAGAALKDSQMKNSMDATSYQVMKVWEGVDAQVKAFEAEGHSAEQVARYKKILWEQGADTQLKIEQDAYGAMSDMGEAILVDVQAVANKLKGITEESMSTVRAAHQELETLQGGISRPGSREEYAFGQRFVITPDGRRIAIGAHGELPDNFDQMYSGGSNFSSGISNQPRIGTGFNVPQFSEGGVGDFGAGTLAMLHGLEAIVPLDRTPTPVGPANLPSLITGGDRPAPVQIVVNVTQPLGTSAQIADVVGRAVMQSLRTQGIRLPSGA